MCMIYTHVYYMWMVLILKGQLQLEIVVSAQNYHSRDGTHNLLHL